MVVNGEAASTFYLPSSAFRLPPSALHLPSSAFHPPPSALRPPPSAFHPPPSTFRLPSSALHPPPSILPQSVAMKHLLKPTGQILTTVVMTSTAVEVYVPLVAKPLPLDSPNLETEPDDLNPVIDATAIAHPVEIIAPPEVAPNPDRSLEAIAPEPLISRPSTIVKIREGAVIRVIDHSNPYTDGGPRPFLATPSTRIFRPSAASDLSEADAAPIPYPLEELDQGQVSEVEDAELGLSNIEGSEIEPVDGELVDGELVDGELVDGELVDGELVDGEPANPEGLTIELLDITPSDITPSDVESLNIELLGIEPPESEQWDSDTAPSGEHSTDTVDLNPAQTVVETVDHTQNWLEQKLAVIVAQARDRQAFDTRQRLIHYARESIEIGDLAEARKVATHPILTPEEQEALAVAIAQAEGTHISINGFIPLVPLNEDLDLIAIQTSTLGMNGLPPVDELPVLPTISLTIPDGMAPFPHSPNQGYSSGPIASPLAQLPLLPLAISGLHQWPGTQWLGVQQETGSTGDQWPAPTSLTVDDWERCWAAQTEMAMTPPTSLTVDDRTSGAALRYHASPRATPGKIDDFQLEQMEQPEAIAPMNYIGTGQQPPSFTTTSFTATSFTTPTFPTGANFLAGVGQQPPSILAETTELESSLWLADPITFQWTRDRLDQELATLMTNTTPMDCQTFLAEAATSTSRQGIDRPTNTGGPTDIGGPAIASLTGYEWLSQFALSQQAVSPHHQPIQMILPLPHAAPLTSKFGWRIHPIYGGRRFHFGIDYGAPHGTPILASIPGRVETIGALDGYGLTVIVENEELGLRTLYAHMAGIRVNKGEVVEQGTVLGWVGNTGNSTGPHLHFEVHRHTDEGWVAMDPLQAAANLMESTQP
ncbi:MAG: M23 family metallopeptidase [Leptolyngbyaceae cyanobacterium]